MKMIQMVAVISRPTFQTEHRRLKQRATCMICSWPV